MDKATRYKVRDFSIYLWLTHNLDYAKVAAAFGLSEARIRQIARKVDANYNDYSVPYWKHVHEVEQASLERAESENTDE